jgi:phosphoglycolate phosphatase
VPLTLAKWTFVPAQPEPFQVLEERGAKFCARALAIQILDPEEERPVIFPAALLRPPKSDGMPGMEKTGRRRREPAAIGNLRIQIARGAFQSEIFPLKPSIPKRLLLFDIDGTLIDSGGAGLQALKVAIEEQFGIVDDLVGIEFAGKTDTNIVHQILRRLRIAVSEENVTRILDGYTRFLGRELPRRKGRLLPGVPDLLPRLQSRSQNVLALLTGNIERGAKLKLAHYGIWDFFEFGAFADDHHDRNALGPFAQRRAREKHAIDFAAEAIDVIGDTPHDIACGKAIGARTIAVATGSFSRAQLAAHQPDALLDDFSEVDARIAELGW